MKHSAAAALSPLLPRGVHHADYLLGGRPVLLAIDRRGNCLKRARVPVDVDEEIVQVWLEGLLERLDPPPLRLLPRSPMTLAPERLAEITTALRVVSERQQLA